MSMKQYTETSEAIDPGMYHHDRARQDSGASSVSYDWSSPDTATTSRGSSSTQLVSPVSDPSDTFNMLSGHFPMFGDKANGLSAYGYTGQSNESASSYPNPVYSNHFYSSYNPMEQKPRLDLQPPEFSFDGSSAALMEAARGMFSGIGFPPASGPAQYNPATAPMAASTQALFQSVGLDTSTLPDQHRQTRSPSPLFEVDESSSPELTEIHATRRNSYSTPEGSVQPLSQKRRGYSVSGGHGRRLSSTMLDPEEKARRAAAAEGLAKPDKRRMQNKLAQRAFRARSRVTNKQAAGRLEDLEVITEQQAERIGKLTDLIGRLQKENQGLKAQKFQEAMNLSMP